MLTDGSGSPTAQSHTTIQQLPEQVVALVSLGWLAVNGCVGSVRKARNRFLGARERSVQSALFEEYELLAAGCTAKIRCSKVYGVRPARITA